MIIKVSLYIKNGDWMKLGEKHGNENGKNHD